MEVQCYYYETNIWLFNPFNAVQKLISARIGSCSSIFKMNFLLSYRFHFEKKKKKELKVL